jgi:hypothetical protein
MRSAQSNRLGTSILRGGGKNAGWDKGARN